MGKRIVWGILFLAAQACGPAVGAAPGAEFPVRGTIEARNGLLLDGALSGQCEALGFQFVAGPSSQLVGSASSVALVTGWENSSRVWLRPGYSVDGPVESNMSRTGWTPSEAVRVSFAPGAKASMLPKPGGRLNVDLAPWTRLDLPRAGQNWRFDVVFGKPPVGQPDLLPVVAVGPGSLLSATSGAATIAGAGTLFVRNASVTDGTVTAAIGGDERTTQVNGPYEQRLDTWRHAEISFDSGAWALAGEGIQPFCTRLTAKLLGTLTVHDGRGTLEGPAQTASLDGKELSLTGKFDISWEASNIGPHDVSSHVMVTGHATSASVDFGPAFRPTTLSSPPVVAAVAGAGILGFLVWRFGALLFTRLRDPTLLDLDARRRIFEAIEANPGISALAVPGLSGTNPNSARYHLDVLRRHGRIRAFKAQGRWHFSPATINLAPVVRDVMLATDPALSALLGFIGPGCPAATAVARLQAQNGLSRAGGWKVIRRGQALRLIDKEYQSNGVMLRLANLSS